MIEIGLNMWVSSTKEEKKQKKKTLEDQCKA